MSDNTIGFIYGDQDINKDKFEIFDRFVDDSKEKITKAADNLLSLYKSDHLDDETRVTLKDLEKKLRIVFKEIDDIDKEEDNAFEYRHTDPYDWAYLIYLSDTNFNSGTRFYESMEEGKQDEVANVRFVQNRLVMFHSDYPHRSWGNHGKNLEDGRLTINGFCNYR